MEGGREGEMEEVGREGGREGGGKEIESAWVWVYMNDSFTYKAVAIASSSAFFTAAIS